MHWQSHIQVGKIQASHKAINKALIKSAPNISYAIKNLNFFGNNTVDQGFGANLKKHVILLKFAANILLISLFTVKKLKRTISTSVWSVQGHHVQHPNAGRNIQQT